MNYMHGHVFRYFLFKEKFVKTVGHIANNEANILCNVFSGMGVKTVNSGSK